MNKLNVLIIDRKERAYTKSVTNFNVLEALKKKVSVEDRWILVDTGRKLEYKNPPLDFNYKFFEEYKTDSIKKILQQEKPDILIISNDYDFFIRSFVPVAKSLGIPVVLLLQMPFFSYYLDKIDTSLLRGRFTMLLDRGAYIMKKFFFMLKTYKQLGYSFIQLFKIATREIILPFLYYSPVGRAGCDLILVSGESWAENLRNQNVSSKIVVTGHVQMDDIYEKILSLEKTREQKRIKLVLMTTGMVEHGLWTKKEWKKTITAILSHYKTNLAEKMDLVIKIHPATERKTTYQKVLKENGHEDIPIYQTEDLLQVLNDSDVVLTYGYSGGTFEAIFLEKPVIVVNLFNYPIEKMPFVKEGLAMEAKNINDLEDKIDKSLRQKTNKNRLDEFITKYIYKFDGKSSERTADAILDLVRERIDS